MKTPRFLAALRAEMRDRLTLARMARRMGLPAARRLHLSHAIAARRLLRLP